VDDRIQALRQALQAGPDNAALRLMLAELLEEAGRAAEAVAEYARLLHGGGLPSDRLVKVGNLALATGDLDVAARCLEAAREGGVVDGVVGLGAAIDARLEAQGVIKVQLPVAGAPGGATAVEDEPEVSIRFDDVGGLGEVKKVIHRLIILPFTRPDLYKAYGRRSGGGVLMFGPPGCGKTLLARAVAGECGLPFLNIRIEDILDPYLGASERNLHEAFTWARGRAPCVVFLDEIDALAYARRRQRGGAARTLVNQILQELDAIGADNQQLLVLAATNAPWDVDDALLRPGRFDRRIFVPPPDEPARAAILRGLLADRPAEGIDAARLAPAAPLFSGADLRAWMEAAIDMAIEEALDAGHTVPLAPRHFDAARRDLRPTTLEWLGRAENYVEFANQDQRYDEVAAYLRSPEAKRHRGEWRGAGKGSREDR